MLLELKQICKEYIQPDGNAIQILKNISFQVQKGDSISIVGPSGSGKTTLLNLIGALDVPTLGSVLLDEENLSNQDDKLLSKIRNRKIGFVFQKHYLLPQLSILDNVLLPTIPANILSDSQRKERAEHLLNRVGLSERMIHRPGQLSLGECQRAAVVRALINHPKLLLADEPTGSLDISNAKALGQLLVKINKEEETALIVVTHALPLAEMMKDQYRLQGGSLIKIAK